MMDYDLKNLGKKRTICDNRGKFRLFGDRVCWGIGIGLLVCIKFEDYV